MSQSGGWVCRFFLCSRSESDAQNLASRRIVRKGGAMGGGSGAIAVETAEMD